LATRDTTHIQQLRSWRSSRGEDLPAPLRARVLDALAYAFDLELRVPCAMGRVREDEVAFWMEVAAQLVETAPWNQTTLGPRPMALCALVHRPLNMRVLNGVFNTPGALTTIRIEGTAVCDDLLRAISKLPSLTSATLKCAARDARVSDAGVSALASSRSLVQVSLTGSSISDAGASALSRLTTLVCLDLSNSSKLTDASIRSLTKSSARSFGVQQQLCQKSASKGLCQLQCLLLLGTDCITAAAIGESGAPQSLFSIIVLSLCSLLPPAINVSNHALTFVVVSSVSMAARCSIILEQTLA